MQLLSNDKHTNEVMHSNTPQSLSSIILEWNTRILQHILQSSLQISQQME